MVYLKEIFVLVVVFCFLVFFFGVAEYKLIPWKYTVFFKVVELDWMKRERESFK